MQERIKKLRKTLNLNQTEFGEKIGAKQTTVAGWEARGRKPSEAIICSICREFGVNENWLRTGDGEMFQPPRETDSELAQEIAALIDSDDEFVKQCILKFLKLSDESKAKFKEFLVSVVEDCEKDSTEK